MKVSFEQALKESTRFIISPDCKTEIDGRMTDYRIERSTVPNGWYVYDVRGLGYPCTLENYVMVNHYGTFMTKTPVNFKGKDYKYISRGRGGYTYAED